MARRFQKNPVSIDRWKTGFRILGHGKAMHPIESTGWSQPENRKCHAGPSTENIVKMAIFLPSL